MAVSFELPTGLEHELRGELRDLDAEAKEALVVSLYPPPASQKVTPFEPTPRREGDAWSASSG